MNKIKTARLNAAKVRWDREDRQRPAYTIYRHGRPAYISKPKDYAFEAAVIVLLYCVACVAIIVSASN